LAASLGGNDDRRQRRRRQDLRWPRKRLDRGWGRRIHLGADGLRGGADNDRLWGDLFGTAEEIVAGDDLLYGDDSHDCGLGFDFASGGSGSDSQDNCELYTSM
jgi:hypothetical protein